MNQIKYFHTFRPSNIGSKAPADHNFVPVNMCFGVKFYLRKNGRLVAGENMMQTREKYSYCGVLDIDTVRTDLLLGHINDLEVDSTGFGNF